MKYTEFVKQQFPLQPTHLSAKEKIKKIAELWRKSEHYKKPATAHKRVHKTKTGKHAKGAGLLGNIGNVVDSVFGLGLEKKKRKSKKAKGGAVDENIDQAHASGLLGSIGDVVDGVFGLGMKPKKRKHSKNCKHCNDQYSKLMQVINHAHKNGMLHGGSFGDMFIKGLTLPFAAASKVFEPLGFGVPQLTKALGVDPLI